MLGDPNCPHCGGVGYLRADHPRGHPDFGKLEICECRDPEVRRRLQQQLYAISQLGELQQLTFESFKPEGRVGTSEQEGKSLEGAYRRAKHYADSLQGWLLLQGGYGVGKTHLAAAVANQAAAGGVGTLFLTVPDLLDELRASYGDGVGAFERRLEQVRSAPLVVLDDFGTHNATEWAREKLFQILNHRYINRLPLVITTNMAVEEIDPRLRSRILDPELVDRVYIRAPDFRRPLEETARERLSSLDLHREQTFGSWSSRPAESLKPNEARSLEEAFQAAHTFAEQPTGWLMLGGTHGVGKTHLAAAIANFRNDQGYPTTFVVVPDLLDHLRATFSPGSTISYDRRFEEIRNAPLLVLDDLGTQATSAWAREKLYQLFNHRYNANLPTVITSALNQDQMDPKLRAQMYDRRRCTVVLLDAPAFRGTRDR